MSAIHVVSPFSPPVLLLVRPPTQYRLHVGSMGRLAPGILINLLKAAEEEDPVKAVARVYPNVRVETYDPSSLEGTDLLATFDHDEPTLHMVPPKSLYESLGLFVSQPNRLSDEVVGLSEIAKRLGDAKQMTAYTWSYRDDFPEPMTPKGAKRVWLWADVEDWAMRHRPAYGSNGRVIAGLPALQPWAYSLKQVGAG